MLETIKGFIHHLLDPHCPHCEMKPKCATCEVLQQQLQTANFEKDQLLRHVLNGPPQQVTTTNEVVINEPEPIRPNVVPWRVRKQMLEEQDRKKAQLIEQQKRETQEAISKLEEELKLDIPEVKTDVQSKPVESSSGQDHQKEGNAQG